MDPNEIIGRPTESEVWLAPDWSASKPYKEGTGAPQRGWTRVSVRETLYANGRRVREVLDENRQPITSRTLDEDIDPEQEKRWKDRQAQAARGDQEGDTRGPQTGQTREVFRGGKWVVEPNPLYQSGGTGTTTKPATPPGGSSETEGTPLPGGGWDNSRPRQVIKDKNGTVIWSEELTGADLTAWRNNQQASQPQTGEERAAVPNRPGWTSVTRTRVQNGSTTKVTSYVGPDGKEVPSLPAETPKTTPAQAPDGSWGYWDSTGGSPRWVPIQGGPQAEQKPVQVNGQWGVWKPGANGGAPTFVPVQGVPTGAEPAGAPRPSGRLGEAAADLEAYDQWLAPQVRSGKITEAQADKLREARRSFWATALEEQQGVVNTQNTAFNGQVTQRNATMTDLANRRTNSTSIANQASADLLPLATKLGGGPNAAAGLSNAIRNARVEAANFVTMSGANEMVPEITMGPALTAVNQMPLPGGTTMAPGFNPRAGAPPAPSPQGAIFRPQPPVVVPPSAPAAAPVASTTPPVGAAAAPPRAAGAPAPASGGPAEPPSRASIPSQPSSLPSNRPDQTQVGSQIDAAIMPPQVPSALTTPLPETPDADPVLRIRIKETGEIRQARLSEINSAANYEEFEVLDPNGSTPVQPSVIPMNPAPDPEPSPGYGKPGATWTPPADPNDPIHQHPGGSVLPPPSEAIPGGGNVQMAPSPYFLAGSSRGHAYDPTPTVQALIADPDIDNTVVRQAVAEMYPGYDIDALLGAA